MIGPAGMPSQRLLENLERLAHFEDAHHVAVVDVAVFAERNAEIEAAVDAVLVDLADVVVDAGGAEHGAGDAGVDGEFAGEDADALGAGHQNFVAAEQFFKLVEEVRKRGDDLPRRSSASLAEQSTRTPPKRM